MPGLDKASLEHIKKSLENEWKICAINLSMEIKVHTITKINYGISPTYSTVRTEDQVILIVLIQWES